jgi:hypothetical protein
VDARHTDGLRSQPEQMGHLELGEFREALAKRPPDQREALILVGASGFSYEEAAELCGCAGGTIKSRLNRARTRLAKLMAIEDAATFGPDPATRGGSDGARGWILVGNDPGFAKGAGVPDADLYAVTHGHLKSQPACGAEHIRRRTHYEGV